MAAGIGILYKDTEAYLQRFDAYHSHRHTTPDDQRIIGYRHQIDKMKMKMKNVSTLRVLSIGSGDGERESLFIDAILSRGYPIDYVVIEPSGDYTEKFEALAKSKQDKGQWNSVKFEFRTMTLQAYLHQVGQMTKQPNFDIVHCRHSAYFFHDKAIFTMLYGFLNDGGMLLITVGCGTWESFGRYMKKTYEGVPDSGRIVLGALSLMECLEQALPRVHIEVATNESSICFESFEEDSKEEIWF
ncbi:histamine N-methyltransferase-like [Ptychodera flava]|uniref:histamine N-methyltransferase-like n=1 Tax=Ptychodera flava TaxID=63121 RepID=UPI003969F7C1